MQKEKKKWDKKMSKWKEKMPTKVLSFKYINLINCPGYWTKVGYWYFLKKKLEWHFLVEKNPQNWKTVITQPKHMIFW